ncbi:unnamed protein product [Vitrella brassicaformis CCMP3155]|uniref:Uncharacterized protein n=1 Tax=Vitrella brassicaformis (strain CCMP3155) TaxID=1169540 RepID=A0A0G4H7B7_VITBC|nr:unnamed protein product [Vitrella brassicaformis CCMP3155]|eukprot:CEM39540.1 unnamed protein product [Vitrella brassicaformis CCMP3155]
MAPQAAPAQLDISSILGLSPAAAPPPAAALHGLSAETILQALGMGQQTQTASPAAVPIQPLVQSARADEPPAAKRPRVERRDEGGAGAGAGAGESGALHVVGRSEEASSVRGWNKGQLQQYYYQWYIINGYAHQDAIKSAAVHAGLALLDSVNRSTSNTTTTSPPPTAAAAAAPQPPHIIKPEPKPEQPTQAAPTPQPVEQQAPQPQQTQPPATQPAATPAPETMGKEQEALPVVETNTVIESASVGEVAPPTPAPAAGNDSLMNSTAAGPAPLATAAGPAPLVFAGGGGGQVSGGVVAGVPVYEDGPSVAAADNGGPGDDGDGGGEMAEQDAREDSGQQNM